MTDDDQALFVHPALLRNLQMKYTDQNLQQ